MAGEVPIRPREGLVIFRWLMVIGSLAPVFVLLAIKGSPSVNAKPLFPDWTFVSACLLVAILPTLAIVLRLRTAIRQNDSRVLKIGESKDSREHLLVYLFALIIPVYQNSYSSVRDVWAALTLLFLIVFILYYLNLHYLNILFAAFGYRVFTVESRDEGNAYSGKSPLIVLSKRHQLLSDAELRVYRISDTVYLDYEAN